MPCPGRAREPPAHRLQPTVVSCPMGFIRVACSEFLRATECWAGIVTSGHQRYPLEDIKPTWPSHGLDEGVCLSVQNCLSAITQLKPCLPTLRISQQIHFLFLLQLVFQADPVSSSRDSKAKCKLRFIFQLSFLLQFSLPWPWLPTPITQSSNCLLNFAFKIPVH